MPDIYVGQVATFGFAVVNAGVPVTGLISTDFDLVSEPAHRIGGLRRGARVRLDHGTRKRVVRGELHGRGKRRRLLLRAVGPGDSDHHGRNTARFFRSCRQRS